MKETHKPAYSVQNTSIMEKKLQIQQTSGQLTIQWRWYQPMAFFLLFFSLFWNSITLVIAGLMLAEGDFLWPLSIHLLAGLSIGYYTLLLFVNKTSITIDQHELRVAHGPFPWWGNKQIPSRELEQLYVIQSGHQKSSSKVTLLYDLRAKLKSGKDNSLVSGLTSEQQALEIEHLLEKHLHIRDEAVKAPVSDLEAAIKARFPNLNLPMPQPINTGKQNSPVSSEAFNAPPPRPLTEKNQDLLRKGRGTELLLGREKLLLTDFTQLDWSNGSTDRQAFLRDSNGQLRTIYAEDRGSRGLQYLEERALKAAEISALGLSEAAELPSSFLNGKDKYYQREAIQGHAYPDNGRPQALQQWLYFTTANPSRFRLVQHSNGQIEVYIQEPIAEPILVSSV